MELLSLLGRPTSALQQGSSEASEADVVATTESTVDISAIFSSLLDAEHAYTHPTTQELTEEGSAAWPETAMMQVSEPYDLADIPADISLIAGIMPLFEGHHLQESFVAGIIFPQAVISHDTTSRITATQRDINAAADMEELFNTADQKNTALQEVSLLAAAYYMYDSAATSPVNVLPNTHATARIISSFKEYAAVMKAAQTSNAVENIAMSPADLSVIDAATSA
ncbi:MAG: hypothetical protein F6K62_11050 [Sphaerospermopsis sp. SIO1G2]|nr:hypothetical protein [Sphaerospermopsis sp. SIO1G2]